ncbi:MAG: T9SS type A sorting domain-containing protein, partial [Bacteroidales bacterium]|nr:T9SS type A sorting domain-containing protein [Bacteroidales bacterium]
GEKAAVRGTRDQGTWREYNVDLSAYAGEGRYIAIRHFNCSDMFYLDVDDIELSNGAKGNRADWTFENGFVTDPGAMANGADASWIKGSQSTWGPNVNNASGYMLADSFTLDATTTIDEITVYGYQTGSSTTSTFTGLYAQIYNGSPMSGGAPVWGSMTSNIMTATAFTNCYRGSDGETNATTRPIMSITAGGLSVELEAGTYYLVYALEGTGSSGPWGAPHCEPSIGNTGNGLQNTGSAWQTLVDSGAGTPYGCAMTLHGTTGSGPTPPPMPSGDIIGAMIFVDGEWEAFVEAPTNTYEYEGDGEIICVRIVYNGTNNLPEGNIYYSMSCPECVDNNIIPFCEPGAPIHAEDLGETDQIKVWWGEQAVPIEEWLYYDDGTYATNVGTGDASATIYWASMFPAASLAPYAGTNLTKVAVYENSYNTNPITVTVYLGGTTAPGTAYSTQTFAPTGNEFQEVTLDTPVAIDGTQNLWIVMAEQGEHPATACADTGDPNNRWISLDGSAWQDLASAGLPGYGWMIRGFVTNQAKGTVENIAIEPAPAMPVTGNMTLSHTEVVSKPADLSFMNRSEIVKYNVYRSDDNDTYVMIGEVAAVAGQTYYEYIDTPEAVGTYYYQVRAEYEDGCESDPALSFDDPSVNYVTGHMTGIDENDAMVALYPNPTKGNVTIEANGMSRITVLSVLGQVVFDTELNADTYTLNMSQFNAGMYMVRVYTEGGVTVKRVTVMQ